ncbi:MAG TPA: YdbL family protein [Dongiaceae bacterium]|nr:YdbL family protein [Dongiaceae bacterium]
MRKLSLLRSAKTWLAVLALAVMLPLGMPAGTPLGMPAAAHADPLDDARAAGQIGERPDGYVDSVAPNPSPAIQQLISDINAQRRKFYEQLAGQKGVPAEEIGALAAEKTIAQKLKPGMYYMNSAGQWMQK